MAIIARGQIVREGSPTELIAQLDGSIWVKTVERSAVDAYRAQHQVISSHLFAGQCVLHVLAEQNPGNGFSAQEPDLEDVYFATLLQQNDQIEEAA